MPAIGSKRRVALYDAYTQGQADAKFAALGGNNTFTQANDFTTMPSVGGDPVVESGSNSDGEWTRWADGTQECRYSEFLIKPDTDTTTGDKTAQWTYPVAFLSNPCVVHCIKSGIPSARGQVTVAATSIDTSLSYYESTSNSTAYTSSPIATGRWK